jgi:putative colanic acid biosynthesis glycosyltransferase WcaI
MRILLVNLYFPPDTSATAKVAESMVRALAQSHEVTVLCGRPSYDPTARRPWKLFRTERVAAKSSGREFTVIRVGSTDYPRIQMRRRVFNYLSYTALAFLRGLFVRTDVIFSMTDPPFAGILAAMLATCKGKPLIYDIQDLYPDMAVAGSIVEPGLLSRIWEKLHRWSLRRAARIIVLGEDMRARIISKGIDANKIAIVRNALQIPESVPSAESIHPALNDEVIRAIRGNFDFVLLHAGNLGFYGAWDTLIAAARQLETDNVGLVFVGDGAERGRLKTLAAGAKNIRVLPFFPAGEIPSVLAAADLHVVTIKRGLEGVVVPSKMFGILSAGKPILAVAPAETDVATLGARHGFGVCANPDDPGELVSAVRQLVADPAKIATMGQSAKGAALQFSGAAETAKLLDIFAAVDQSE